MLYEHNSHGRAQDDNNGRRARHAVSNPKPPPQLIQESPSCWFCVGSNARYLAQQGGQLVEIDRFANMMIEARGC